MFSEAETTEFLKNPVVDKCLGLFACLAAIYTLYYFWILLLVGQADIYRGAIALNMVVILITTMIRRTAKRVSINPFFWGITFLRIFWGFTILNFVYVRNSVHLIPLGYTNAILFLGVAIIIYSRFSLGRNIGFIPARRELVTTGAYGYARHPIHTGELIFLISYILSSFTLLNFTLLMMGFIFIVVKSLVEESFLKDDKDYQEYCKKVPWRWVPKLI